MGLTATSPSSAWRPPVLLCLCGSSRLQLLKHRLFRTWHRPAHSQTAQMASLRYGRPLGGALPSGSLALMLLLMAAAASGGCQVGEAPLACRIGGRHVVGSAQSCAAPPPSSSAHAACCGMLGDPHAGCSGRSSRNRRRNRRRYQRRRRARAAGSRWRPAVSLPGSTPPAPARQVT
jgi:hypothetical protein